MSESSRLQFIADETIRSLNLSEVSEWVLSPAQGAFRITNAAGSLLSVVGQQLSHDYDGYVVWLAPDDDRAAQIVSDLISLGGSEVYHFKPTGLHPYDNEQVSDPVAEVERLDLITNLANTSNGIIVTSPAALYEKVPRQQELQDLSLTLSIGTEVDRATILEWLDSTEFEIVDFVSEPGEAAVRGGIIDVFPFSGEYPIRVEFFGDEVDTLREFDQTTQRSVSNLQNVRLVPGNILSYHVMTDRYCLLDLVDRDKTLLITTDEEVILAEVEDLFAAARTAYEELVEKSGGATLAPAGDLYASGADIRELTDSFKKIVTGSFTQGKYDETLDLEGQPQPDFNSSVPLLKKFLSGRPGHTIIVCDSKGQQSRLQELLEDEINNNNIDLVVGSLHEGYVLPNGPLAVLTDHQIFNRFHRPTTRKPRKSRGLSLRALQDLSVGDFVVHVDYGIGTFNGLKTITVRDKKQEAAQIVYKDNDTLYVNVNAIHKLHKYSGKEGHQPQLTKLGTGQWERKKARTKKHVKDIARDLIQLYARRRAASGHAFPKDTVWQQEMEASFQYEDTPDQSTAIDLVKKDMMESSPMDRLVCGDVGFGKTEVAVRAAFKAVQDGKQVAVLVPTTILAEQHLETFTNRLKNYPVRIAALSRFRSREEQKQIIADVASGKIDLLIGTHRITSKDLAFKNLGLLIIDEEQRFGVSVKEKLRKLKVNVDTLTLTATPIPRTLQFSLLGARDLSIISTPPPNRQAIVTEIHTFDTELIRDAILYELNRGGQVFFIHNRVKSIEEMATRLREAVPDARIRIAHGQMPPRTLENVMFGFKQKKFDVLLSTNIIENGLDISNANTIIINHANRFGLAELHQLRGRVGRSDRKAFCYLLVSSVHGLTKEARQRLQALEEFSNLGAGFGLAMRDMDIRGAGNLLGAEQSGFITDVGFETYHKILDEAVRELRQDEFTNLFSDTPAVASFETVVDLDVEALIPTSYIFNNIERLNLYRRIAEANDTNSLLEIKDEMQDRFGTLPPEVTNLFAASDIRLLGQQLHLPRIAYKNRRLFLSLPPDSDASYFSTNIIQPMLKFLDSLDNRYVMKPSKKGVMRAIVQDVPTVDVAIDMCRNLGEAVLGKGAETPQAV